MIRDTLREELRRKNIGNNKMASYSLSGILLFYFILFTIFYIKYRFSHNFLVVMIPLSMLVGPITLALEWSKHSNNVFYSKLIKYTDTLTDEELERIYEDNKGNPLIKCKGSKFYLPEDEEYSAISADKYFFSIKQAIMNNCYHKGFNIK
jgi:hypothetical protein